MSEASESSRSTPVDLCFDLFVYAPLGFALEAPRLLPELAAKGRNHVNTARAVGQFAAQMLERKAGSPSGLLGGVLAGLGLRGSAPVTVAASPGAAGEAERTAPRAEAGPTAPAAAAAATRSDRPKGSSKPKPAAKAAPAGPVHADDLPIAEYDSLAASQVVPRLVGLTPAELRAVQAYEQAGRGRRTVLNRVAQLLGDAPGPTA